MRMIIPGMEECWKVKGKVKKANSFWEFAFKF
jgi:hypothetical protein